MEQKIDKFGNLTIPLFDIIDQKDADKFYYFYMGLDRSIKKVIENAFYQAYTKNLLDRKEPHILHSEENGITYIEVDPSDIIRNIEIIKKIIATNEVVQEDENE